ncbi:MAG: HNH endonuclease [Bacteroidetes bacterium]|nr:HNH endonuclease [Bacteroidota bacterium]
MTTEKIQSSKPSHSKEFSKATLDKIWRKGEKEFGFIFFRRDRFGVSMSRKLFRKKTKYGWEVDYCIPLEEGGTDTVDNLIPVHWSNVGRKVSDVPVQNK